MNQAISLLLLPAILAQSNFQCPREGNGYYQDEVQCDKYYACREGQAEPLLCPDGLVFDELSNRVEPCDHYFNVDCEDRLELQTPQGTSEFCPRLNGFYAHPDPGVCHIFFSCVEGVATEYTCSSGLWFDEYSGVCNWPDSTDRTECAADAYTLETPSGFQCPQLPPKADGFLDDPHPTYANDEDCKKFFICLNGISPREQGCEDGLVYDILKKQCTEPEEVEECKDYYKEVVVGGKARKK